MNKNAICWLTDIVKVHWHALQVESKQSQPVRFLVSTCVGIFLINFFLLWNDVQLQSKLLDRLDFCRAVFKTTFSHRGMNVCLICEASLSHHTLCMGNLVLAYTMYHPFPCLTFTKQNKSVSPHRFWSRPMTRYFFGGSNQGKKQKNNPTSIQQSNKLLISVSHSNLYFSTNFASIMLAGPVN